MWELEASEQSGERKERKGRQGLPRTVGLLSSPPVNKEIKGWKMLRTMTLQGYPFWGRWCGGALVLLRSQINFQRGLAPFKQ